MASIDEEQLKELNSFLKEKGLIQYVNRYLKKNKLHFKVESLKLESLFEDKKLMNTERNALKDVSENKGSFSEKFVTEGFVPECRDGFEPIEECSENGSCRIVCKRIPPI